MSKDKERQKLFRILTKSEIANNHEESINQFYISRLVRKIIRTIIPENDENLSHSFDCIVAKRQDKHQLFPTFCTLL